MWNLLSNEAPGAEARVNTNSDIVAATRRTRASENRNNKRYGRGMGTLCWRGTILNFPEQPI